MTPRISTAVLVGVWTVAMIALLPSGSRAQNGGGGNSGGPNKQVAGDGVECAQQGTDAHYEEILAGKGPTMVRWAASDTSCPNHINWPINPNFAWVAAVNNSIPAYPMLIENGGTTDLSKTAGGIGIMRNGVSMFSAWAKNQVVEYEDTAFYLEADSFDPCGGHATAKGVYHYHGTAGCLQEQAGAVVGEHSPLLGWSMDGFPFYGQLGPGGVEMKMCGADGADPIHCLDGCMGYEAFIDEDEFAYRYYTSCGYDESFFPFSANCFRGCCPDGVTCDRRVQACSDGAKIGYSGDHVPVISKSLADVYDATLIDGDDVDILGSKTTIDCTLYLGSAAETTEVTVDPTVDETAEGAPEETTMPPVSGFTCSGEMGILAEDICCTPLCGTCGGNGCTERDGGEDACCKKNIRLNGALCSVTGQAPCIVDGSLVPGNPEPTAAPPTAPTAAPTVEETEEPAMPVSGFTCEGEMGIRNEHICCASSCGTCGGHGCTERDGGEDACCLRNVRSNGALCSVTGQAPCIVDGTLVPGVPEPTAAPTTAPTTARTVEETEEPAMPVSGFTCEGEIGIRNKDICCALTCGTCGGAGCSEFQGGEDSCCTSDIRDRGQPCVVTGAAPCIITTEVEPDTPELAAGATVDETDEWVTPMPDFLCEGEMGIRNKDICCASSCGTCGGAGCTEFDGGEDACCMSDIRDRGQLCAMKGAAPCILTMEVEPDTETANASPMAARSMPTYREIGCFADKSGADRVKTNMVASTSMTVEICQKHCVGSMYFGVQWSVECWCDDGQGDIDYPFDTHGPSEECTMACAGDATEICGGDWAMNVYENI